MFSVFYAQSAEVNLNDLKKGSNKTVFVGYTSGLVKSSVNSTNNMISKQNTSNSSYNKNNGNCYAITNDSHREACLGNAYSTDNPDARNIILKSCFNLSDYANKRGLREVCLNQKSGCSSIDSNDRYKCESCNGSNKWARLYAVGQVMQCY